MKIGVLIISTGKYHCFIDNFLKSARTFFLKKHDVVYFLFTDYEYVCLDNDVVIINHKHLDWPFPTLFRYKTFHDNRDKFEDKDYLFYCDIDMLFVGEVGDEILGERVATIHPCFEGGRGTPETNINSLSYIGQDEDLVYYAGGFNGGSKVEYLKMCDILNLNIDKDLEKGIIALWHDESHMNRYFIDNPPVVVLDFGYCYPECFDRNCNKKIIALNKDHKEIRKL